jgi:hypothetical protein
MMEKDKKPEREGKIARTGVNRKRIEVGNNLEQEKNRWWNAHIYMLQCKDEPTGLQSTAA